MADTLQPATPGETHVVVVGAGIGGLVSALLLAARGVQVTLVEAAGAPGGKMRQVVVGGQAIDAGPTVFTMRWVFEQILAAAGATLDDLPPLQPLSVLARHAWRGHGRTLDLYADRARSIDAVGDFAGAAEARRFVGFCDEARAVYRALDAPYIRSARPTPLGMARGLGLPGLAALARLGLLASLWQRLGQHFQDPRLRQLFGRYATYCGASPWHAPATLMLIAQVELDGVWAVEGGMHAVAQSFATLAHQRGVHLRYLTLCKRILLRNGRVAGVVLQGGETLAADAVVFNGTPQALAEGLLGDAVQRAVPALPRAQRSLSALTWCAHTPTAGFALERHNVFFDDDYRAEFDDVFSHRRLPRAGTVYVCAQDRGAAGPLPAGQPERLLCLVNAPADGDLRPFDDSETEPCRDHSLNLLQSCGLQIDLPLQHTRLTTPADFHRLFPGSGGALYGEATHGWMSSFRRPGSVTAVPGLFLAGGGVHPGPGVPMAALSGQRAAEALMAHLASTSRSRRVATSGGTSTPSATTAATL
ncbi:MAG: phytoene desaturase [Rubrivivax sp.]|nr:phytoene desaturase [Rubrivivax sp.]